MAWHACCCKVGIECLAQVLATVVRVKYFDPSAVLLSEHPCFEGFVGCKCLIFCSDEEDDCKASAVVCEGGKVAVSLPHRDGQRALDVGVDLISKVLHRHADVQPGYGEACGAGEYAGIAGGFLQVWIQLDPSDYAALN
jgi:hypothetical protein